MSFLRILITGKRQPKGERVLLRLSKFFSPSHLLSIDKDLVRPRMEYASHVCGDPFTRPVWTECNQRLFISSTALYSYVQPSFPQTPQRCCISFYLFFAIFMLTACIYAEARPHFSQSLYARLNMHLQSFISSTGKL